MEKERGLVYFAKNKAIEGLKIGRTQLPIKEKEQQLSQPPQVPGPFRIFAVIRVKDWVLAENKVHVLLSKLGIRNDGETYYTNSENIKILWPSIVKALGPLVITDYPHMTIEDSRDCSCRNHPELPSLRKMLTVRVADSKGKVRPVLSQLSVIMAKKGIALPPAKYECDFRIAAQALEEMTGLGRQHFTAEVLAELTEALPFCQECFCPPRVPTPRPKPFETEEKYKKILRETYQENPWVKEVAGVYIQRKKQQGGTVYRWRAELILVNDLRYNTRLRQFSHVHLRNSILNDREINWRINPDIEPLNTDEKVAKRESEIKSDLCRAFGYVPNSIDVKIAVGRNYPPQDYEGFRKDHSEVGHYRAVLKFFFLLDDGRRREVRSRVLTIKSIYNEIEKGSEEQFFDGGKTDSRMLQTRIQSHLRCPVTVSHIRQEKDEGGKSRTVANFIIDGKPEPNVNIQRFSEKQLAQTKLRYSRVLMRF